MVLSSVSFVHGGIRTAWIQILALASVSFVLWGKLFNLWKPWFLPLGGRNNNSICSSLFWRQTELMFDMHLVQYLAHSRNSASVGLIKWNLSFYNRGTKGSHLYRLKASAVEGQVLVIRFHVSLLSKVILYLTPHRLGAALQGTQVGRVRTRTRSPG